MEFSITLRVSDVEESVRFWDEILCVADLVLEDDGLGGTTYAWGGLGPHGIMFIGPAESAEDLSRGVEIGVQVPCVLSLMGRLEEYGVPNELTLNWLRVADPDGNVVMISETRRRRESGVHGGDPYSGTAS